MMKTSRCSVQGGNLTELLCHAGTQAGETGPDVPVGVLSHYERGNRLYVHVFNYFHAHVH